MINHFENFNQLADNEISEIVKKRLLGVNTIVYAFDGSIFSNQNSTDGNNEIVSDSNISFEKLLNDMVMMCKHGIKTICYPMWNSSIDEFKRSSYNLKFLNSLKKFIELFDKESFVKLFKEVGIRINFYGDYKLLLKCGDGVESKLLEKFEMIMKQTKENINHTILIGFNIEQPSETIINTIISYYNSNENREPTTQDLIEHYYGVFVDPVSLYLGSGRFSTDGRPILISDKGNEDLYYTICPHEFLSTTGFRKVLFDKLFCRSIANAKEYQLKIKDIKLMKEFYLKNCENVMGVGNVNSAGNYWYPDPQVVLPNSDN
ncbi:hypothetical protein RB653_002261 [Dictyostelium firmibasis]|uniref:Uncharacterized protein n=1 Tax=Dictyostelium firmibasis TaxID=79012 RepID=A0AAN7U2P7_9MYCE